MRVLFAANPGSATFQCMVPTAWALRTAGHDVRVASQPGFVDEITQAGLTAVGVGRDLGVPRLLDAQGETDEEREEVRAGLPWPYQVADDPGCDDWHGLMVAWHHTVQHAKLEAFAMAAGLVRFAQQWQPDLVVWEPFTPMGAVAAKACGAAHARILHGIDVAGLARRHYLRLQDEQAPADRGDPLAEWLGGYARKFGAGFGGEFTEDMAVGHFTIDQVPDGVAVPAEGLHYLRAQYVPYSGPAVVPKWLQAPIERPRVALSLGTTAAGHFAGYTVSVPEILDALADLDVEVVATVAEPAQAALGTVPANARVVSWVPLHALAPTCSAAIDHAGFGTALTFARYGVPQLALPYHFDEPMLARGLAREGAALVLGPGEATGPAVRDAVVRLLREPGFARGAGRLGERIHDLPSPNDLVEQIEELTAKHRSR